MLRSLAFQALYYLTSAVFVIGAMPLLLLPSAGPTIRWIDLYARTMVRLMRHVAGITLKIEGREHLPEGPFILAAKHQSWGDGFCMMAAVPGLAFVTGDHLLKYPLLGPILRKLGAVVVNNCGGAAARGRLLATNLDGEATDRPLLIYPEGHLSPVGEKHRYRRGVWHLAQSRNCPVVPVATDLGLRWPQQDWRLTPGPATLRVLPPLKRGLEKEAFMARLEEMIEQDSRALLVDQVTARTWPKARALPATLTDPEAV